MSKTITIHVTQQHIDAAIEYKSKYHFNSCKCPIALATTEILGKSVVVTGDAVCTTDYEILFYLPSGIANRPDWFHAIHWPTLQPFSFVAVLQNDTA